MTKQKIVIIGAGKIAYSLVPALINSGFDVGSVISRKQSSAGLLSKKFSIRHHSKFLNQIPDNINIFILTVPDGEIKKVAEKLSKLKRDFRKSICIHFSGVENISALKSLQKKGCTTGSLHIIRPFPSKSIVDLKNSPASIEAENKR
ncbi:MAG TPA: NAD(P)-binding domain-containing protein, partial [Ignavibacteriaceae bacterium]